VSDRVVISGISCISSFGLGYGAFADAVHAGRTGIRPIDRFDTAGCHSHNAAAVRDFDPARFIAPLKMRRIDAVGRLALSGAHMLFDDAGCRPGPEGRDDVGVALGTFTAGLDSLVEYLDGLVERGPTGVPAILFSNTVANAPASLCAIEFGLRGPNVTFNQREASGIAALAFGVDAVRHGRATTMVCGGADSVEQIFFKVHDRFRALSPMRGTDAREAARPFDRDRNGFTLGEGCFLLLVESAPAAAARGARVFGEILGIGAASTPTPPNEWPATGAGLARAMRHALADAALASGDVGAVIAASNGSPALDRVEAEAIVDVFGGRVVPVASVKGAVGESGAAGIAGVIAGLLAFRCGDVPPTAGLSVPDPGLRLCVSAAPQAAVGDTFLLNSVASGGTVYSVAVRASRQP
jgi:3-oxoacyl-[acyl-carrier-protein] synthase II